MSIMTATAPAASPSTAAPHFYRHHHPFASPHGDASYTLMLPERSRRAEGHARKLSELTSMRDRESINSHFHPHSDSQVPPIAAAQDVPPLTSPSPSISISPSYCPRIEVRASSLSQLCHPSPTPSLRASMSFNNTNATLTWGSPAAWSPSAASSSSSGGRASVPPLTSRVRHEEHRGLVDADAEEEASEMNDERSADEEPLTIARRGPLMSPVLPSHTTLRPLPSLSPHDRHAESPSSSSSDGLAYRSRQHSWSPESRRPTLPSFTQLQLPNPIRPVFPEFIQGSSRPGSRPSSSGLHRDRGCTVSPPPSPSPSTSSVSTSEPSGGRTDTDPTDDDEYLYIKREPESVKLPPIQSPEWIHGDRVYHQSTAPSSSSASPSTSPFSFRAGRDLYELPSSVSDLRTRVLSSSEESLPPLSSPPRWTGHHDSHGRPYPLQYPRNGAKFTPGATDEIAPTPKKFRFVASKPQAVAVEKHEQEDGAAVEQRGRTRDAPALTSTSGTKRRYAHISPAPPPTTTTTTSTSTDTSTRGSAVESTTTSTSPSTEEDESAPRKRAPRQQPFDIGLFPASEQGGRMVRGPRGSIVPAYHYDTERALVCAFASCGAVLSGKKSETASHMRSHFLQAAAGLGGAGAGGAGQTLMCPWLVEGEDGQRVRCAMPFKDSANFGRHVSSKHIRAEEYQCNRCGRPFARRDAALRHMKTLCRVDAPVPGRRLGGGKRKGSVGAKVEEDDYFMYDD